MERTQTRGLQSGTRFLILYLCKNVITLLGRRVGVRQELQVPDHAPARVRHHPAEAVRGRQAAPRLRGHCGQRAREPEGGQAGGLLRQPGEHHVVSPQLQVHLSQRLQCNNNNNETIAATAKG